MNPEENDHPTNTFLVRESISYRSRYEIDTRNKIHALLKLF